MLTQAELKELVHYNPDTGIFTWAKSRRKCRLGDVAGARLLNGYIGIRLNYTLFLAHRLAWLYMTGKWPKEQIDHINGERSNNIFCNLRESSNRENSQNRRIPSSRNKTGFLGVAPNNGRFGAFIKYNGKTHWLGDFNTPEEAHSRYVEEKRIVHSRNTL